MDRSQSSAEWALLLLVAGLSGWLRQDAALEGILVQGGLSSRTNFQGEFVLLDQFQPKNGQKKQYFRQKGHF